MNVYVRLRDVCICRMNDRFIRFYFLLYMIVCIGEIYMY